MNISELEIGKEYAVGSLREKGVLVRTYRTPDYRGRPKRLAEFRFENGELHSFEGKEISFTWDEYKEYKEKKDAENAARKAAEDVARKAAEDVTDALARALDVPHTQLDVATSYREQVVIRLTFEQAAKLVAYVGEEA